MDISDNKLKNILVKGNYLDEELDEVDKVLEEGGQSLQEYLLTNDLITGDILGQALAEEYGLDYFDLNSNPTTSEKVHRIPQDIAQHFNIVVVKEGKDKVRIATSNPEKEDLKSRIKKGFSDKEIELVYSLENDIRDSFVHYQKKLDTRFAEIIENKDRVAPEILNEIFVDAQAFEASDIHFEPRDEDVLVRFRIDGVLQEAGVLPKKYYKNILNRIKVMSNLRIDEHFIAQDGSMHYKTDNDSFDVRTSIVPTVTGEKTVLRMLSSYIGGLSLANIGLSERNQKLLTKAAKQPFGMILVTGPTGSGKTTTLYSLIHLLEQPKVNITTIEDPVEYKIEKANQIQVDKENNLTFSEGLRSIVRQDPDIILVGEIRDEETARISVNAALTGHLLLSTFHSNDAATAIPRLLDMGIESFLLSSTLELLVAQRLVRKICENCRHSVTKKVSELEKTQKGVGSFFNEKEVTLYEGEGCNVCNGTGFDGRTAVFEIIEMTTEMQELVLEDPSTSEVWKLARKQGVQSMFEDGIEKVKEGVTTLEEVSRVIPLDDVRKDKK
jgi:type IV pilus assembly protein PilB